MKSKPINTFTFRFLKLLVRPVAYFRWGYRYHSKYKIKKGEPVVVLSNHQTDLDPLLIHLSFNRLLRTIATDNIFKKGRMGNFIRKMGAIPKRKGIFDFKNSMQMIELVNKGESLLFFPEGNRAYADFQYYISDSIGKTIKKLKATLILFNIHGGFGRYPRFGLKPRKGRFYGDIVRVIPYEEYSQMEENELTDIVINSLKVFDSMSGDLYKSKARAEYLERMLFVCPKCGMPHKLTSKGNIIKCSECGLEVTYNEDLSLSSSDPEFKFKHLVEWYNYQKHFINDYKVVKGEKIFEDDDIVLMTANPNERSQILHRGSVVLYDDKLVFGDISFDIKDIAIASPVSGRRFIFTIDDKQYDARGDKRGRFNPLKYVFMFNKLDTKMKLSNIDKYYSLEDEKYDIY